jgi:hypothetical protein
MRNHPLNLVVRFALELTILAVFALWGWRKGDGAWRYVLAIGLPLRMALRWGAFHVEGDHGKGLMFIPGPWRLALEFGLFAAAAWFLFDLRLTRWGWIFLILSVAHYAVSYDRVLMLLKK